MITLNNINLSSIDLSGIDLRGIKLGLGGRGGGSGDGFPVLPGDVTRWHFGGLTNEMMAAMDDPRIEDADHKGRFLSFKNFAWSGMSGVNGYKFDFLLNEWVINNNQVSEKYSYKIVINNKENSVQLCNRINLGHIKITLKITGIEINKSTFRVYDNAGTEHKQDYTKDGIYEIDYTANEGANIIYFYVFGGNMGQLENPITIEQLPLYPGALVFDGVDDYGTCDNFPVLTKEKGYTVVALRSYLAESIGYLVYNGTNAKQSAFAFERSDSLDTWSWGKNSSIRNLLPKLMSYQTSNSYNNNIISTGTAIEGDKLIRIASVGGYSNVAIWELVFLDHDATEEELTKIKDYFVKTYPWLFPDQAWTVTGKTNEDEDRATIANITGNGNDLVLSNFGFAEGSGYNEEGEYAGYLVTDGVDDMITSSAFEMGKDFTVVGEWRLIIDERKAAGLIKPPSFYLFNENNGLKLFINNIEKGSSLNTKSLKAICSDGRVYFDDWSEMLLSEEQPITSSSKNLSIGYNGTIYTQMAFKNLGIYNDQLLSKDDCIKAYNYLQTLKAK